MLLTPQPDSSRPANTVKGSTRARRGMRKAWLMLVILAASHNTAIPMDDTIAARYDDSELQECNNTPICGS
jgi:hypothetical protein